MPDPQSRIAADVAALKSQGASDDDIEAYLKQAGVQPDTPAPIGHAGKKFVDAPEMLQQHKGVPFVDAEPEPSYAQQALGGIAALGRHISNDAQPVARAITRDRGIPDLVQAVGNEPPSIGGAVRHAVNPLSTLSDLMGLMQQTPSYQRAQSDIQQAEDSNPVSDANAGIGLAVGLAPLIEGGAGALKRAVQSPDGALTRARIIGKPIAAGKRALAGGYQRAMGVQGPMESALSIERGPLSLSPRNPGPSVLEDLLGNSPPAEPSEAPWKPRSASRARMNRDAEAMGLPVGPPPPQGAVRAPDAPDSGVDLLEALRGFAAKQKPEADLGEELGMSLRVPPQMPNESRVDYLQRLLQLAKGGRP